jgi:hypothetical protein
MRQPSYKLRRRKCRKLTQLISAAYSGITALQPGSPNSRSLLDAHRQLPEAEKRKAAPVKAQPQGSCAYSFVIPSTASKVSLTHALFLRSRGSAFRCSMKMGALVTQARH